LLNSRFNSKMISLLSKEHANRVKIYNLCSEPKLKVDGDYKVKLKAFELESVPCFKIEPIKLSHMIKFCIDAIIYLNKHDKNTIAVHCDDGKERTSTMICAFLIFYGLPILKESKDKLDKVKFQDSKHTQNLDRQDLMKMDPLVEMEEYTRIMIEYCQILYKINIGSLNKYCETIVSYMKLQRVKDSNEILKKSQIRYLKLFALYLFNNIKIQSVYGNKILSEIDLDSEENYTLQTLKNYGIDFDKNVSFYREFFWMLAENSLEDLLPENKPSLLWPLYKYDKVNEMDKTWTMDLKLYHTNIKEEVEINIMETRDHKNFIIRTKGKPFGENRKNIVLNGDFGVIIKLNKQTYTIWLNVR
jgi:hypothetical protein